MRAALLVCDFVLRAVFLGAPRGALCVFARRRRHRRRRRRRHRRRWRRHRRRWWHARQLVAARRTAALRRDDRPRLALASRAFALAIRSPALVDARERRGRRAWRRWRRRGRKRQRRRRGRKRGGRRRPRHASNPRILTVPARRCIRPRALDEVRFPSRALHAGEADRPGAHPVQRAAVGGHRTREAEVAAHDLCVVQVPVVVAYLRWGGVGRSAMCMRGVGKGRRRRSRRLRLPSTRCRRPP